MLLYQKREIKTHGDKKPEYPSTTQTVTLYTAGMFPIQTDARDSTAQKVTVALARPPRTASNNATWNRHSWVFAGCLLQWEDGWAAKLRSDHRCKLFSEEFRAPLKCVALWVISIGIHLFFVFEQRLWMTKRVWKPVYFKVRVETDMGRGVSCVGCLPASPWHVLWIQKPPQEMWAEEVKSLYLVHHLWGPWPWNMSESQVF